MAARKTRGRRRRPTDDQQPDLFETLAQRIADEATRFAAAIQQAASRARNEEQIRVAVERQLALLGSALKVEIEGEHEYTLLRGRIDSAYGSVFIEYKNPASPSERIDPSLAASGTRKLLQQIQSRFKALRERIGSDRAGILGIGFDGRYFLFVRYVDGEVSVQEPVALSAWSARQFLWALFNLKTRGYALTPESLSREFGTDSRLGREGVKAFADALTTSAAVPQVATLYSQWRILFSEVCGVDLGRPGRSLRNLAEHYGVRPANAVDLLFALHTYYALLMKLLAAHVVSFHRIGNSPLSEVADAPSSRALLDRLRKIEEGGVFRHLGITNFLEGDLFAWYLAAFSDKVEESVRSIASSLLEYNPASIRDNPAEARDLLKKLYHELFPRALRHDLGEFYTPDWLAEVVLDRVGYDGDPRKRVLDPACGSGTFLVLAMARIQKWVRANFERAPRPDRLGALVARNLIGFDLNPLAVLAARTNFLIQFYELLDYRGQLEIPIYLCDSILTPSEYGGEEQAELSERPLAVPTSAKLFYVPREVTRDREILATYCNLLAEYARVGSGFSADDFVNRCLDEGLPLTDQVLDQHKQLFRDIRRLDEERRNGVWARFIKNAFAPVFVRAEPVDYVVGNPPWVNWESLPGRIDAPGEPNYRQRVAEVFNRYGLFSLSGSAARHGGGKKDLSMPFVYVAVDHYLKDSGRLGYVITQSVFKTKGAGDGFRRFRFGARSADDTRQVYIVPDRVEDMVAFQPFEGANNRTGVIACRKSTRAVRYPVSYTIWRKTARGRIDADWPLSRVLDTTKTVDLAAVPIERGQVTSPWLTAPRYALAPLRKIVGQSDYRGYEGVNTGGLSGCYWVRTLRDVPGGVLIENLHDAGKIKVDRVSQPIEPDLLYPLMRGRDVDRWKASPSAEVILAQDPEARIGIPEAEMRRRLPRTFSYFKKFEDRLRERALFRRFYKPTDPFYSMYNVGPYTMAPWKVVWPEIGHEVTAAVRGPVGAGRIALPDHTVVGVACESEDEAHYVTALLNSSPACALVRGYITLHPSPHVLEFVRIPEFDAGNQVHRELAKHSKAAHAATESGSAKRLATAEQAIDEAAAKLWGLSAEQLAACVRALATLRASEEDEEDAQASLAEDDG